MDPWDGFSERFVKTRYGNLHCFARSGGAGKALVLLHGLGADTDSWKRLVEHLPESVSVVAMDLLGHGKSDKPEIDYTIMAQSQAVVDLIQALQLDKPVFFGHSYGGWISAFILAKAGLGYQNASGLVLEDSAGLDEEYKKLIEAKTIDKFKEKQFQMTMRMNNNRGYVIGSIINSELEKYLLTKELLSGISVKAMIIWGSVDRLIPFEMASVFNDYISGSRLERVEGAGHTPHFTHAAQVASLISGFVGGIG